MVEEFHTRTRSYTQTHEREEVPHELVGCIKANNRSRKRTGQRERQRQRERNDESLRCGRKVVGHAVKRERERERERTSSCISLRSSSDNDANRASFALAISLPCIYSRFMPIHTYIQVCMQCIGTIWWTHNCARLMRKKKKKKKKKTKKRGNSRRNS